MSAGLSRRGVPTLAGVAEVAITQGHSGAHAAMRATARLFTTEAGTGKNVVLLHGWTCDSHDWSWQLPLFESEYRVVAADQRGHGRSEVMPSGAYTPADYVAGPLVGAAGLGCTRASAAERGRAVPRICRWQYRSRSAQVGGKRKVRFRATN
jgi:pimeloyl-ACP methyl ester carboxylesterase